MEIKENLTPFQVGDLVTPKHFGHRFTIGRNYRVEDVDGYFIYLYDDFGIDRKVCAEDFTHGIVSYVNILILVVVGLIIGFIINAFGN